jgi:REP-associated tyrosine transposase
MSDHMHLFVRVGPADAPAAVVRAFKGRTAHVLRQEFPHLRNFAKVLWSPVYFAASVGYVSETMVRRYIEHHWDAVLAS